MPQTVDFIIKSLGINLLLKAISHTLQDSSLEYTDTMNHGGGVCRILRGGFDR
jgi:hypothetical protein